MAEIQNIPLNEKLRDSNPKINQNFQNLNKDAIANANNLEAHKASKTAHAAQNVTYQGTVPGVNVKEAIENVDDRISEIVAQSGNDNTEVVDARGGYTVLSARLNEFDRRLSDISFNVKSFGAKGDGTTNDTEAIQGAVDTVLAAGGGIVYIPPGIYVVSSIQYRGGVVICGAGIGVTTVKLADNTPNVSVFNCTPEATNVCIRDLTIDGNRDNQIPPLGHGIRSGTEGGIINGLFTNLHIKNTGAYGIGLQKGTFKNVRFENITTENTGLDGIDIKNISNNNDIIFFSNITVINPGLDTSQTVQAGIDCRGPVVLQNIIVRGLDRDQSGIRFRPSGEATGIGGGKSSLTNFSVYGTGTKSGTIGVSIGDADVRVANGYVYNTDYGIISESTGTRTQVINCEVDNISLNGVQVSSEYFKLSHSIIRNSGAFGVRVNINNVELKDNLISGSILQGVRLPAGFTDISLFGNDLRNNTGGAIRDDGATYTARNNKGWITEVNLISPDIDCSTTGIKTATIVHGMSVTPALYEISLTPIITGGASYLLNSIGVVSVNGTSITVRVNVVTAQASSVCKLSVQVRSKI